MISAIALIVAPLKFAPVIVTKAVVPTVALGGVIPKSAGAKDVTVNVTGLLTPSGVVTSTERAPNVALAPTVKVAVIWVGDTDMLLMLTPTMGVSTAPVKLEPVMITGKAAPTGALGGLIPVRTGPDGAGGKVVSNERLLLCPADVNTLKAQRLSGAAEIENSAKI